MDSYSPAYESLDLPISYRTEVLNSIFWLRDHPPSALEQTCHWIVFAQEMLGELIKDPSSKFQVYACVVQLARAMSQRTGINVNTCFDTLNDGLEHPPQ